MIDKITGKRVLIDGDIIKYHCAASAEKTKYLVTNEADLFERRDSHKEALYVAQDFKDAEIWTRKETQPLEYALQACKTSIKSLLDKLSPSSVSIFLSPGTTFRVQIGVTAPYKGNRDQPKPRYLKQVEEYLVNEHGAVYGSNVEADDLLGINLTQEGNAAVCCSIDKDLLQVPGWHYNWINDTIRQVSPREGDYNFYLQMLTGDATDNILGLVGIGPVKAAKILSGSRSRVELATRVWREYQREFGNDERARSRYLENAGLLWILREAETGRGYQTPEGFIFG